ncbi:MAG: hypothetical protein JXX28_04385 [Deltaproteobacteria bacterium]|nr:hypothetical protein [Deltaproteobacteria bacterium]
MGSQQRRTAPAAQALATVDSAVDSAMDYARDMRGSLMDFLGFGGPKKDEDSASKPNPHATRDDPLGKSDTGWGQVHPSEAVNYASPGPNSATRGAANVVIHHGPSAPVQGKQPAASDLFTTVPAGSEEKFPTAAPITGVVGDVEHPYLNEVFEPSLFRGAGPTADDVSQGQIGDCYFMAVIGTIASSNPAMLSGMMSLNGNQFTANFWARDPATGDYFQVPTTVSTDLSYFQNDQGQLLSLLVGAGVLLGESHPEAWWVDLPSSELEFWRQDAWEGAMWVSLLEKAYMRFAQDHGQYGLDGDGMSAATKQTDGTQRSGYEINEGGYEYRAFEMFYGPALQKNDSRHMSLDASSPAKTVSANADAIRVLLRASGVGVPEDKATMMTAWATGDVHVQRFGMMIEAALAASDIEQHPELKGVLEADLAAVEGWAAEADATKKAALLQGVAKRADGLAKPGNWPLLHAPTADKAYRDLLELAANVAEVGTDKSAGTRNVYSGHAYMVLGADFSDATGANLALDPKSLSDEVLAGICAEKSVVHLRNPHHTNEPDLHGDGPADGVDDGAFDLSLDQFFRNMSGYDFTNVKI